MNLNLPISFFKLRAGGLLERRRRPENGLINENTGPAFYTFHVLERYIIRDEVHKYHHFSTHVFY